MTKLRLLNPMQMLKIHSLPCSWLQKFWNPSKKLATKLLHPFRSQTVSHLMEGRDLIGQAETGSGKTAAFAWPLLSRSGPEPESSASNRVGPNSRT